MPSRKMCRVHRTVILVLCALAGQAFSLIRRAPRCLKSCRELRDACVPQQNVLSKVRTTRLAFRVCGGDACLTQSALSDASRRAQAADAPTSVDDEDFSAELPRIPPVEPRDAVGTFVVAPGFHVELVAAEPLVQDPIAMSFDESGRLYVVEMHDYSEDAEGRLGKIRLLTDIDGDGRFDASSVFADNLSWPTAVICYDGGIFVGAAPDIVYCKDNDGDGHADVMQKVFTGFGRGNVQGLLNSFAWGLDNRITARQYGAGATVRRADD